MEERSDIARRLTIRDVGPYSARNSSKGALISEAERLLRVVGSGVSINDAREQALRGALLSQRSSQNRERIWTSLQQRYLFPHLPWLTLVLAEKSRLGSGDPEFTSLLYLLYALRDRLTYDFVTLFLWPKGLQSRTLVSRNDVLDLLKSVTDNQPQISRWSGSTRVKLAGSVLTALRDFGVLEGKQRKFLVQPPFPLSTAEALLRILIAEGCRGRHVLEDHTWRLFLLTEADVAQMLARLAQEGVIRFEKAGSTVVLETPADWETEL